MRAALSSYAGSLVALLAAPAFATLSNVASDNFGASALTLDSETNLRWLSPNETSGLSFNEVSQLLVSDSRFSEFRAATVAELELLYQHAGIPDINVAGERFYGTETNVPGVKFLQGLTGTTYSVQVAGVSLFATVGFIGGTFISPVNNFQSVYIGDITLRENVQTSSGLSSFASASSNWSAATIGTNYMGVGTWLVSSVPEPSSALMMSFMICFAGLLLRRVEG